MLPNAKIRELRDATDLPTLVSQVEEMLANIGLEYFMFANIYHKHGQVHRDAFSRWPSEWFPAYYGGGYYDHNHCVEFLRKHRGPLNILDVPRTTAKHHELHELTLSVGVNSGALTTVSPTKPKLGMLYACSSDGRQATESTVSQNLALFPVIANEIYDTFDRIQKNARAAEVERTNTFDLNQTEILVLMWAAEGLSNLEIAMKLGRQESTIKKHLQVLREQMNASNMAHAVAIGLRHGLID